MTVEELLKERVLRILVGQLWESVTRYITFFDLFNTERSEEVF